MYAMVTEGVFTLDTLKGPIMTRRDTRLRTKIARLEDMQQMLDARITSLKTLRID